MIMIAAHLHHIQARIAAACHHAGRPTDTVTLLAVSKTFPVQAVRDAALAGQRAFGENYVQEGVSKIAAIRTMPDMAPLPLQWHCIGPIQSNKTKLVAQYFDWAHTVDRIRIAQRLSEQRPAELPPLQVCIQVNVDGGSTKSGCAPQEVSALAQAIIALPRLQLRGVMGIPDTQPTPEATLAVHCQIVEVFRQLQASLLPLPGCEHLDTVSLGMTADLDCAIQAGSTMVRIGSGIFGQRNYSLGADSPAAS